MADDNSLKRYLRKRIRTIIREISTPADERTPETFHRLRVEIKKIKALFSLIEFVDDGYKKHEEKYFEPFKPLFKKAGDVRKLQLEEDLMRQYKLNKITGGQLLKANKKKQEKAILNFEKKTGKKVKRKIGNAGADIEKHLTKIYEKDLIRYNNRAFFEIKKLVRQKFIKEITHEVRKQIKSLLYNLKLTVSSSDKIIHQTDRLQVAIGKWHDGEATVIHLNKILSDSIKINAEEEIRLQQIIKKIIAGNKKLFLRINEEREKLKMLFADDV